MWVALCGLLLPLSSARLRPRSTAPLRAPAAAAIVTETGIPTEEGSCSQSRTTKASSSQSAFAACSCPMHKPASSLHPQMVVEGPCTGRGPGGLLPHMLNLTLHPSQNASMPSRLHTCLKIWLPWPDPRLSIDLGHGTWQVSAVPLRVRLYKTTASQDQVNPYAGPIPRAGSMTTQPL